MAPSLAGKMTISMPSISIPPQTAEQLRLLAAATAFSCVGTTFAGDIAHTLRHTKAGRRAIRWVYQHPTAARCLLLTSTGALIAAWPGTVAKLVTLVTGIGATKGKESGFTSNYRGGGTGTTGFIGILQSAAAGRAPGLALIRNAGYALTALSGVGALFALQWRRLRGLFYTLRNKISKKGTGSSSSSGKESSRKSRSKEDRKDKERESSTHHHYNTPSFPSSSSSAAAAAAAAAAPPPPPVPSSSSRPAYGGVTSPPASEFEDHTDAESIYSRKGSKSHRSSKDKKDKKDKDKKHRK